MVSEERHPADLVEIARRLAQSAPRLGFFELVSFLERLTGGSARVGGMGPVADERVRFRHDPSLGFPAGDVAGVALRSVPSSEDPLEPKRPQFEVTTTFLGLTGAASPLPAYLAEEVAQEDPDAPERREFLDFFHHRLLSLLYRLESKYSLTKEFVTTCEDQWSRRVLALAGIDTYDKQTSGTLKAWQLLRLAPLLAQRSRTGEQLAVALEEVLADDLEGARVRVRQFIGQWVEIDTRFQLGSRRYGLGRNTLLGSKAFDRMGAIRLEIAPLPPRAYKRLLPEGDLLPVVREVVALFVREPLQYNLELGLTESVTQTFRLSSSDSPQLGRETWLGTSRQFLLTVPGST